MAVVLGAAELALRSPRVRALLPPRTHYYHPTIAQRLDALERLTGEARRVDVLFIGSSIVLTNLHPVLFDRTVEMPSSRSISFNAGLPGLWPSSVHLYLEHVWLPAARPRLVVQGIRYPELAATTHAKNETQVWTGRVEAGWRESDVLTRLSSRAVSSIHLLQYRGALTLALEAYRSGLTTGTSNDYRLRGYEPRGTPPLDLRWEEDLPNEGTCEAGACEVGFGALRRSIQLVRRAGAVYVLLNVPEHVSRWRDAGAAGRYAAYVDALRAFAESEGVAFVDPTDGSAARFADLPYYDFSHMTTDGSRIFTVAVAERLSTVLATTQPRVLHAQR